MTAINVFLQRDRAWLITDSAWYDLDGVVHHFAPKSQAIGHWPGAIATRGPGLANAALATEAGFLFPDFDAFADGACAFLEAWCQRETTHLEEWAEQGFVEVIAIGWSKRLKKPRGIFVSSKDERAEAQARGITIDENTMHVSRAFELTEIESGYVRPLPTQDGMDANGVDPNADFDSMEVMTGYGMRVVAAQRELREPLTPGGDPICFVGGYIMNTIVSEGNVTMIKGVSFPDQVGQRVNATRHDLVAANDVSTPDRRPPPGMTRQQRRAWESQQRKNGGGRLRPV